VVLHGWVRREGEGRGVERRCCCHFIGRRGKGAEAVAWELDRPTINGGGERLGGAAIPGRGRAEAAVGEWGGSLMVRWRRRTGAGRPGRRGRPAAREASAAGGRGVGSWRWEISPTGEPHLSARGRERRGKWR
jgi:hypothetical protein